MKKSRFYTPVSILTICLLGTIALFHFHRENSTSGITISSDFKTMTCSPNIKIEKTKNIDYYLKNPLHFYDLRSQICTYDEIFDGYALDRVHLLKFSDRVLESPLVARYDIAQYFYHRIIEVNPDDAMSLYLKKYKLE
ncbi:MAG: hypothetical protein OEY94_06340 [Alphaproteobacteria bacterium]|nr:hypothetical protein [Alphaproteobacteria bacterium]